MDLKVDVIFKQVSYERQFFYDYIRNWKNILKKKKKTPKRIYHESYIGTYIIKKMELKISKDKVNL